jgi:hypothetical protein
MKNITIILPIYKLEEEDVIMMTNAITSVEQFYEQVKLLIVCPKDLTEQISKFSFGDLLEVKIQYNKTNKTDFISQLNMGIEVCDTDWFSILEIDDEYKPGWLKNVNEYMEAFKDVDIFLPIIQDVNSEGNFYGFTNESLWAYEFTEKLSYLDNNILTQYQNFQTSGGLYKTQVIKENGSFKDNIKLTFSYEFLLRMTNNNVIIKGIPKVGYKHVNFRENSLFWNYKNDENLKLSENEVKFWIDTAKKEFFFKNKRDISYVE